VSAVLPFPAKPAHYHAGLDALRVRARAVDATSAELRQATLIFTREYLAGRSTAAAVALAHNALPRVRRVAPDGAA
jgi:hypothetical protein